MRLSRQKAILLLLVSSIACHNTTGPATVSAFFTLQTINGRPLPTFLAETPGPTATITHSALTLDTSGKAVMIETRRDMFQIEATYTSTLDYRINGNQIEIGSFRLCAPDAICAANLMGTLSPSGLSLVIKPASNGSEIVYNYQRLGLD